MLKRCFPSLEILPSKPDPETLREVIKTTELLVHSLGSLGCGGSTHRGVAQRDNEALGILGHHSGAADSRACRVAEPCRLSLLPQ